MLFRLCIAVQAAVSAGFAVGEYEYVGQLLLCRGDAAGVFALDDVCKLLGKGGMSLAYLFAVLDEVNCDFGIDKAENVEVYVDKLVDFDNIFSAALSAGGIFDDGNFTV